ncbi:thioredoxin-like domain-containing protein [Tautonia plasticadhaerens]|uniref:Thiol-disulfide oxidoreductase YkuV n=1 Tax=Tautonia plasticadhaerens TaxID=2527974 RepID=A0A518GWU9_9BACT|nr:thioredoxin-like domain-containing protein [Tautonia plasticadhaerens]QDV33070.1 Thiol-disulfide oxidoreductase YkuV [Tautonia plasticadhaerens]
MTTPSSPRRAAPILAASIALLAVAAGMAWLARTGAEPAPADPFARMNMVVPASFKGQEGVGATQDLFEGGIAWLNSAQPIRSQDLIGKVVLLDFWTYCCINCHHIIPDLEKLERKYADELVVIGVHSPKFPAERDTENIRKKVREYGVKHPVVNDAEMTIWRRFGVRSWPTLAVIDAKGNFRGSVSGEGNYDTLDAFIGKLVEEHKANGELDETPFVVYAESDRPSDGPLLFPGKVLADAPNNRLFIADTGHHRVVVTDLDGAGQATIGTGIRGFKDGPFDQAQFDRPQGFCLVGDALYVTDTENHAIRRVDLSARTVETIAGNGTQSYRRNGSFQGSNQAEGLNSPWDLLPVPGTSELIIAMAGPHQLWKIDLESNLVSVWAGSGREDIIDGSYGDAAFAQPSGLATDGTYVYVADSEVSGIRRVSLSGEQAPQVGTVVGQGLFEFGDLDGVGDAVRLQHCLGLAYGDDRLYIADTYNNKIKVCDPEARRVETLVGTGEAGSSDASPSFYQPGGISLAGDTLYIADSNNHLVRAFDLDAKQVRTLSLDGVSPPKPPKKKPTFANATPIELPMTEVAPGDALTVDLSLEIPGFKLQPDSPVLTLIEAPDSPDALGPEVSPTGSTTLPTGDALTLPVPLSKPFGAGDTLTLKVSASIFACAEEGGFCTLKQYSWTVPLAFAEGAGATVTLAPPAAE